MKKISSILPSTPRMKAVDLKSSHPVRPGGPTFGRPVGVSTLSGNNAETTAAKAHRQFKAQQAARVDPRAEIVNQMASGFFMKQPMVKESLMSEPALVAESTYVDYTRPDEYQVQAQEEMAAINREIALPEAPRVESSPRVSDVETEEEMDLPDLGRYLDVNV